jgi:broad specificity phosphatase PhoE
MDEITHILVSPLRRTLETCLVSFNPVLQRGVQPILWADLREFGGAPCNKGTRKRKLKKQLAGESANFSLLEHGWHRVIEDKKYQKANPNYQRLRGDKVLEDLFALGETIVEDDFWKGLSVGIAKGKDAHVLVVSHGGILASILGFQGEFPKSSLFERSIY